MVWDEAQWLSQVGSFFGTSKFSRKKNRNFEILAKNRNFNQFFNIFLGRPADFILNVVIDNHPVSFFVHKRPHVDYFLETVSQWFDLVVFTASMEVYGKGKNSRKKI